MSSNPLPPNAFRRLDENADEAFYAQPRFVTHIDDEAIAAVTELYRQYFPQHGRILDLMSSWISHLPDEVSYSEVAGLGMNEEELRNNERLSNYTVQNLNTNPVLDYAGDHFDGAAICVSIDYLTQPVEVLREVARCLKPEAPLLITFSNRCFPSKAVAVWHACNDRERVALVERYLEMSASFDPIRSIPNSLSDGRDPLYAVIGHVCR